MKLKNSAFPVLAAFWGFMLFCSTAILPSSCNTALKEEVATDSVKTDLRIGVLPILEALPFYYAQEKGICDSLGIHVEILPFMAQFDSDTALLNNAVDLCMMDRERHTHYINKGHKLSAQLNINTQYALVASKELEAKNVRNLNNYTLAISRHSGAEDFAHHEVEASGLKREDVHYPQINNIWLRADMLTNRQVDAAVLPMLQAIEAELQGHTILKTNNVLQTAKMQLVYPSNTTKTKEINALVKAYELAKQQIQNNGLSTCRNFLIHDFHLSEQHADSIIKRNP